LESKRLKTGAVRSDDVQDIEHVEAQRLVGVLNGLVHGMTGARFGVSAEAAVHYMRSNSVRPSTRGRPSS